MPPDAILSLPSSAHWKARSSGPWRRYLVSVFTCCLLVFLWCWVPLRSSFESPIALEPLASGAKCVGERSEAQQLFYFQRSRGGDPSLGVEFKLIGEVNAFHP